MKLRTIQKRILTAVAVLTASLLLIPCLSSGKTRAENSGAAVVVPTGGDAHASAVADTDGLAGVVFFGESTTAHLSRAGGVLDTPTGRRHVWRDGGGTRMLDRRILTSPVDDPDADVSRTLGEMLETYAPDTLVLSFGLNGAVGFSRDVDAFLANYRYLIEAVHRITPDTRVVLQSIYPVRNTDAFSVDSATLNRYLRTLNGAIASLADGFSYVRYVDTASVLRDADGVLAEQYDSGDGIHLTNAAYEALLSYLRAHL